MAKINDEGFLELSGIRERSDKDVLSASSFPILQGLSPLNLRILNQSSRELHVMKGVEMIHAGDTPYHLCFIVKGSVLIAKQYEGKLKKVAELKQGDFYGEYAALRGKTRFASVLAAENSTIIYVNLKAVQQVMDADAAFKHSMSKLMHQRLFSSFLSNHTVFSGISEQSRSLLSEKLTVLEVSSGEVLFNQGEGATKYYMVLSGEIEILVDTNHGSRLIDIRRDNKVLGESRRDKGAIYAYTARAANDLDLLVLDQVSMKYVQQADMQTIMKLKQVISQQAEVTAHLIGKAS